MGALRACVCGLILTAASFTVGACGDDDSSSSTCYCEWGDGSCYENLSSDCDDCARETYSSSEGSITIRGEKGAGPCSQVDVIGSCYCDHDNLHIYYRAGFDNGYTTDPQADCENYYDDCVYTPR